MPLLILSDNPPESYVMVLPTSTTGLESFFTPSGAYSSRIMQGLFSLALPTLINPSHLSFVRSPSFHTLNDNLHCFANFCA